MKRGAKVTILIRAGLVDDPMASKFAAECDPGTVGTYDGTHHNKKLAREGWHLVRVGEFLAPLHAQQFKESR